MTSETPQPVTAAAKPTPGVRCWGQHGWWRWGQQLYVRIWLAVVLAVAALTILVGWAWRMNADPPLMDLHVRNAAGEVIGTAQRRRHRPWPPHEQGEPVGAPPGAGSPPMDRIGLGPEFFVTLNDGQQLHIHLPRPPNRSPFSGRPYGFFWLLAMVGLAVAVGTYPIVRRLTRRLETLQQSVEQWGNGDLSARVAIQGADEVGQLAARFNHAAQRIEALVKSHKSLLANASHELRSPLTRIRMGLELLGPASPSGFQEEIKRNIAELDQLVDEILLASRLDSHEADLGTVETVDLTGLLAEECARHGAHFCVQDERDKPATHVEIAPIMVTGVVKLIRRAVRNLLENARRYSQGDIHVSLERLGAQAVLRVADQGPGVPEALRERIFEPFYRLPGASEQSGGVGLGLALVKSITERMQGTVRCEANPGGGACFVLTLPALPEGS